MPARPASPASQGLPCPCGRQSGGRALAYAACCGRYVEHAADLAAPDAESLMRSRYSAFVLQREGYLLATWHASRRPAAIDFEPGARWLGLQVRAHRRLAPDAAEVEFVARQRGAGGRAWRLHECSRFVLQDQRWYYVDGTVFE